MDYTLRIRRTDFVTQLEQRSEELVDHAKAFAAKAGRPYEYRQGRCRKEQFIQDIIRRDNLTEQLVAVLCTQETRFPYTIQVYVNGHDWLTRQMLRRKMGLVQRDNAFTQLDDPAERRRRANAVSRLLKRLHVRGLIARIPRTRRWRVTQRGHSLLGAMIRLHYHGLPLAA